MNQILKKISLLCITFSASSVFAAQEGKRPDSPLEIGPRYEIIALGCLCNKREAVLVCKKCNEPAFCSQVCKKALNNRHKNHCPGYFKLHPRKKHKK